MMLRKAKSTLSNSYSSFISRSSRRVLRNERIFSHPLQSHRKIFSYWSDVSQLNSVSYSKLFSKSAQNNLPFQGKYFSSVAKESLNVTKVNEQKVPFVSSPERKYEFFQNVDFDKSGIATIRFDDLEKKVNTISFALNDELKHLWDDEIHSNPSVKAVIFSSAKKDCFVAGADIFDIKSLEDKQDILPIIESGIDFCEKMRSKQIPIICAIHGPALGGGLELALWCEYRICSDSPKTKLGLPEVKLGLLPGFGGTQNLFKIVGIQNAMDMMLTGKDIRPSKAKKMGLVDLVVDQARLEKVAMSTAKGMIAGSVKPKRKPKSFVNRIIEDTSFGRQIMWKKIEEMVQKQTNGNYPSPLAIIECVKYGLDNPEGNKKFKFERESFAKLAATKESEALIGIFEGMNKMKKHSYGELDIPIKNVAVLGAGLMGAGIAQISAEKGYKVLLKDRDDKSISRGEDYMMGNWHKKLKRKRMTQFQFNKNSSNIVPLTNETETWKKHFHKADMIIEAVPEVIDLKKKILAQMEEVTPDNCIFATNTSAIPIKKIAEEAKRPELVIGMHYFSPVPSMPLLEIIPHDGTADEAKAAAYEVGIRQGKTCIEVKDVPGFYVNRCLGPFLIEVSALISDGVPLEILDKSMKNFGMPVGPITLADEVGIDIASHVATFLSNADLGARMHGGDVTLMNDMVKKGWLGKKSGQGFYTYSGKKKTISAEVKAYINDFASKRLVLEEKEIQDRMVSRFVNEAAKCLEDDIIADPTVGDIGLVFGTGFAPFKGGPFRYLDTVGVFNYVEMMNRFTEKYGPQFEPCQLLKDYATSGKLFHD